MSRLSREAGLLEAEIAHLRSLNLDGLRARSRTDTGRRAPEHLPKHLLLRILAYRLQAAALGDLDKATLKFLEELQAEKQGTGPVPLPPSAAPHTRAGTVLVREWNGVDHRVTAIEDGYAWNGKTLRSLSEVAFAITGTRWSGPRFFGLKGAKASQDVVHASWLEPHLSEVSAAQEQVWAGAETGRPKSHSQPHRDALRPTSG